MRKNKRWLVRLLFCGVGIFLEGCSTQHSPRPLNIAVCLYSTKSKSFKCSNGSNSWSIPEEIADKYVAYPPEDNALIMSGCLVDRPQ